MGGLDEGLDGSTELSAFCAGRRGWFATLSIDIMAGLGLKVTFRPPFFGVSSDEMVRDGSRGEVSVVLEDAIVYR